MAHPQHPNCSACGKALFKSPAASKVKPADPYAFCRNATCAEYTFRNDRPVDTKKPTPEQLAKAVRISGKALDLVPARAPFLGVPKDKRKVGKLRYDDPKFLDKASNLKASKQERPRVGRAAGMTLAAAEESLKAVKAADKIISFTSAPEPAETKPVSKRGVSRRAVPLADAPTKPKESEPLAKARTRVRELLAAVTDGHPKESISLVLAILNQETGNQKAAEVLIDEFQLSEKYGLLKFT